MSSEKQKDQARLRLVVDNDRESDGYMSGRSSCLETPEAASTDSTRSAGTRPDRRHFCSAWYRTPSFAASGCKPPPASMTRSTSPMRGILQPLGVIRQQPPSVLTLGTMQLMVADAKRQARERFSEMLNSELARLEQAPARGRPAWLKRELKSRAKFDVTITSCQKWLGGKQIPRSSVLAIIVKTFGMNHQLLMAGEWEAPPGIADERLSEINRIWASIPDDAGKKHVLEAARIAARQLEPASSAPPTAPPRRKAGSR